ncbi:hypothetical protein GE09DRAFT_1281887, partial [Coniochaeta sp. 2T2.1]
MQLTTFLTSIFATLAAASPTVVVPDGCANGAPGGIMARVPVPLDARNPSPQGVSCAIPLLLHVMLNTRFTNSLGPTSRLACPVVRIASSPFSVKLLRCKSAPRSEPPGSGVEEEMMCSFWGSIGEDGG